MSSDKIGLYIRNSTVDQKKQRTEENQIHDLKMWLADLPVHFTDEDIYIDRAQSGGSATREQYNLLLSRLDQYDAIAVWDSDRLVRDIDLGLTEVQRLRQGGKRLYEFRTRKIYDLHNFADLFMHVNFMMMSSEEKQKARERREAGTLRFMRERGAPADVQITPESLSKYWPHRPKKYINWQLYDKAKAARVSHAGIARMLGVTKDTLRVRVKERQAEQAAQQAKGSGGSQV